MIKEIQKIVRENLPTAAAGVMSEFIAEAEQAKLDLIDNEGTIQAQEKVVAKYREMEGKWLKADKMLAEANARAEKNSEKAKELQKTEDRLDNAIMQVRLEMMNANMANMQQLVTKVFGHPGVSVTSQKQVVTAGGVQNQYGGYDGAEYTSPVTETETTVESKT